MCWAGTPTTIHKYWRQSLAVDHHRPSSLCSACLTCSARGYKTGWETVGVHPPTALLATRRLGPRHGAVRPHSPRGRLAHRPSHLPPHLPHYRQEDVVNNTRSRAAAHVTLLRRRRCRGFHTRRVRGQILAADTQRAFELGDGAGSTDGDSCACARCVFLHVAYDDCRQVARVVVFAVFATCSTGC